MTDPQMWVHYVPSILNQGRTSHIDGKPIGDEEVESAELLAREVAKDPWEPRLKSITLDKNIKGDITPWVLRKHGVKESYLDPKTGKYSLNYGTVHVKSMWWPGAHIFYH